MITVGHPIFTALQTLEQTILPTAQDDKHHYHVFMPWAVSAMPVGVQMLEQLRVLWKIPGYQAKHFVRLLNPFHRPAILPINSMADALQLKHDHTRIRGFYAYPKAEASMPVSVKRVKESDDPAQDATHNEIRQRHYIEATNTVTLPRLLSSGTMQNHVYMIEELIKGRRFKYDLDIKRFVETTLTEFFALYKHSGIEQQPVDMYFPATSLSALEAVAAQIPTLESLVQYMKMALGNHYPVDVALCHGDLVPSNLCVAHGTIYCLDWGECRRDALIPDILRLAMRYPKKADYLLNAIWHRIQIEDDISHAGTAFAAAIARASIHNPKKSKGAGHTMAKTCAALAAPGLVRCLPKDTAT